MSNIKKHILENGVTVYFYSDPSKHSTSVRLLVNYGGHNLDFKIDGDECHIDNGIAHLLEHYVCECNETGHLITFFGEKQINANAVTFPSHTDYHFQTVDNVNFGIENLIKLVNTVKVTEEKISSIKKPIYREIQKNNDNELKKIYAKSNENLFSKYRYINGLGTEEYLRSLDYRLVEKIYQTFYQPKNQIFIVGGNFDEKEVLDLITKTYKPFKNTIEFEYIKYDEPKEVRKKYDIIKMPTSKPLIKLFYKLDISKLSCDEQLRYDYYLPIFFSINFGSMSKLYKDLLDKKILIGRIGLHSYVEGGYWIFCIYARTDFESEFIDSIKKQFRNIVYDEELFDLIIQDCKIDLIKSDENYLNVVTNLWSNIIEFNTEDITTASDLNKLSFDEMKKYIDETDFSNCSIIRLENLDNQ